MLEFKLNEENYFEFEMSIVGDADAGTSPSVGFNLTLKDGVKMTFIAERKDSVYSVKLPALKKYLIESGEYDCDLSVFLGDKFFKPFTGKCMFKEDAKPVISNVKVENKEVKTAEPIIKFVQTPIVKNVIVEETPEQPKGPTPEEIENKAMVAEAGKTLDKLLKKRKEK